MDEILIVLVVYKCRFEDSVSFKSILDYNRLNGIHSRWVIFDNSATVAQDVSFRYDEYTTINLRSTGSNDGLPLHYNNAFEIAKREGIRYVLLLDQDTHFTSGLTPYIEAISANEMNIVVPKLMAGNKQLSPSRYFMGRGFLSKSIPAGFYPLNAYSPLNSGSLINVSLWSLAGGFNGAIKLDFSDYSFFQRVQESGIHQFLLINYVVSHELSTYEKDVSKILTRFRIYVADMNAFLKECSRGKKLLLLFWGCAHFLKVLYRTGFNKNVAVIYFSGFSPKNVN
jgi:rhamnosyltransferase